MLLKSPTRSALIDYMNESVNKLKFNLNKYCKYFSTNTFLKYHVYFT